jgi:hypothetical protein
MSRSDLCVDGFEALSDRGCSEPLGAFSGTSGQADAQVRVIQQAGHGFGEPGFIAGGDKKAVFPVHDHIDYSASCGCDHRTTTGHRLEDGRRAGIKADRWKYGKKAAAKRGHNMIVWPLCAHLSTVGKVRRRIGHAAAD